MKKTVLVLSTIILIVLCATSLATSLDISVFPKNTFNVFKDEFTGEYTIGYINSSGTFEHSDSGRYQSEILASVNNYGGQPKFGIYVNYMADSWIFADDVMIKIGDNVYTFENASIQQIAKDGDIRELFWFTDSTENGKNMLNDWADSTDYIRIRLSGQSNFDFTVPSAAQQKIADFYKLYLKGCGLSAE